MPPFALLPWRHLRLHGAQQSAALAELHFAVTTEKVEKATVRTSGWSWVIICVVSIDAMIGLCVNFTFFGVAFCFGERKKMVVPFPT